MSTLLRTHTPGYLNSCLRDSCIQSIAPAEALGKSKAAWSYALPCSAPGRIPACRNTEPGVSQAFKYRLWKCPYFRKSWQVAESHWKTTSMTVKSGQLLRRQPTATTIFLKQRRKPWPLQGQVLFAYFVVLHAHLGLFQPEKILKIAGISLTMVNVQLCLWPTDVFMFKFRLSLPETLLLSERLGACPKPTFNTFWRLGKKKGKKTWKQ